MGKDSSCGAQTMDKLEAVAPDGDPSPANKLTGNSVDENKPNIHQPKMVQGPSSSHVESSPPDDPPLLPASTANIFSKFTLEWLSPLLKTGSKRPLQVTDLWRLDDSYDSLQLAEKLLRNLERRQERAAEWNTTLPTRRPGFSKRFRWTVKALANRMPKDANLFGSVETLAERYETLEREWRGRSGLKRGSLAWALSDTFPEFWMFGPLKIIADVSRVVMPLVMKEIIHFSQEVYASRGGHGGKPDMARGVGLAFGLYALVLLSNMSESQFQWLCGKVLVKVHAAFTSAIYQRAFGLSVTAKTEYPTGKLITYITADTVRIMNACSRLHGLWSTPISVVLTVIFLCLQIGPAGLIGFVVFVVIIPAQTWVVNVGIKLRRKGVTWTEKRSVLLQDLLGSMAVNKMFTYEIPYLKKLNNIRNCETSAYRRLLYTRSANQAIAYTLPSTASVFAFVMYSSFHPNLNTAVLFTAYALFGMLRPVMTFLPMALGALGDAVTALDRIAQLFEAEQANSAPPIAPELDVAVRLSNASFQWPNLKASGDAQEQGSLKEGEKRMGETEQDLSSQSGPFALQNITLSAAHGTLVTIVGPVGSGKSCLLQALFGDMCPRGGTVDLGGRLSYCSQVAWIQNATVRDNVVFGQTWDEVKYWTCIQKACLLPDLEMLPDGDLTEIGEKGVNLSGGQKQRINIARALYYDANIVLFDDPLSAVDAHVGRELFKEAILDQRNRGKSVLLVTHALHFLPSVDYIYTMSNGRIEEEGTFAHLIASDGPFKQLWNEFVGGGTVGTEEDAPVGEVTVEDVADHSDAKEKGNEGPEVSEGGRDVNQAKAAGTGKAEGHLMVDEERKTGVVGLKVYMAYMRAAGWVWTIPSLLLVITSQGPQTMAPVWLVYWQENKFHQSLAWYQGMFGMLAGLGTLLAFSSGACLTIMSMNASKDLYRNALKHIFFSPMSFFDTTPMGRILGIFSKDMDVLDNMLAEVFRQAVIMVAALFASISIIAISFPYFVAMLFGNYFRRSSREIKRLESMMRSIMLSQLSESLAGHSTIRAFQETDRFIKTNGARMNMLSRAYMLQTAEHVWLGIRLENIGGLLVLAVALMCTVGPKNLSPNAVALSLSYMVSIAGMLSATVDVATYLENAMNAVERTLYYSDGTLPQEPDYEVPKAKLSGRWPSKGALQLDNLVMSYRSGLPAVLKDVSVNIAPGERVGIVGRTGAGKTSITVALFRLAELTSGRILLDGVDISTLGLKDLRASMAIIPQDPVLYSGTLRYNLDPFNTLNDATLHDAMRRACLLEAENEECVGEDSDSQRFNLDMDIDSGGCNLSIGQRSLVSLARAFVKDSRVMVLDEATAAVDLETDSRIQSAIRQECARGSKTVICIAHRLRTIIGWDKILVMDAGTVHDFGSPLELFDKPEGIFRTMCDGSGITREEITRAVVEERLEVLLNS